MGAIRWWMERVVLELESMLQRAPAVCEVAKVGGLESNDEEPGWLDSSLR